MALVLDASVALAYLFDDERTVAVESALSRIQDERTHVPCIWPLDVLNGLIAAERRKALTATQTDRVRSIIGALPIEVEPSSGVDARNVELQIARECAVSIYDAAYLALAQRRAIALATIDAGLARAAKRLGVSIFME